MLIVEKSAAAEQDLIGIWLYSFQQWGEAQADRYLDGIERTLSLLTDSPLICREREELSPPVRIHRHEHHMIVYTLKDESLYIIRVLHESMDFEEQMI